MFVLGLVLPIPRNRRRRQIEEEGCRLKGPEMVTVKEFNRRSGGDGISFLTTEGRESLSIPRSLESSHMMMMGDRTFVVFVCFRVAHDDSVSLGELAMEDRLG
jgi:hypothetical protein